MALYILFGIIIAGVLLYIAVSIFSILKSKEEIEKAVKNGACCSVNHWVKKTLKAALK